MAKGLKICCLGGGPASLYFSILMKKANPAHDITVVERGDRDSTWGFGVVFSVLKSDGQALGGAEKDFRRGSVRRLRESCILHCRLDGGHAADLQACPDAGSEQQGHQRGRKRAYPRQREDARRKSLPRQVRHAT